jgi:hypothetical protein
VPTKTTPAGSSPAWGRKYVCIAIINQTGDRFLKKTIVSRCSVHDVYDARDVLDGCEQ